MDPTYTREYENYERHHWWFLTRREIIHHTLDRFVPAAAARHGRWLDVGCGTGVLIESYQGFSEKVGTELDDGCVARARENGLDVRKTLPNWDFSPLGKFDCISLCDVLEHVEHEGDALRAVDASLKEGGTLLITVPALMSIWSDHDVVNHHFRRYTREELKALFPPDKWDIQKLSYFCSMLFPLIWLVRQLKGMLKSLRGADDSDAAAGHDLKFGNPMVDRALRHIFRLEDPLLQHGDLPIGSSLLMVARKKIPGEIGATPPPPKRNGRVARWLALGIAAILFTLINIRYSMERGRLSRPPTYDDISYFIDALSRVPIIYGQSVGAWVGNYIQTPPHSPYSSYLALAGYVLFGIKDWAPYALNAFLILALLWSVDHLMRGARIWQRLSAGMFVLSIPLAANMVTEFRPDLAWALCAAMAVILPLRRSLVDASWKRQMAAGAWCAAALLTKTSIFPLTLMTVGAAWLLGAICDRLEKGSQVTLKRVIGAWLVCAVPIVLFALPHYIVDFAGVRDYIGQTLSGKERELWSVPGDRAAQLRYYIDGVGGGYMLGGYIKILAVVLAVGFVALARGAMTRRRDFIRLLRAASLAFIAFIAYAIPAVNPVKNPFFGSEFQVLLVLGAVLAMRMLLVGENPKKSTGFGIVLLLASTGLGLAAWRFPPPFDGEMTANTNRVVHSIERIIFDNASANANVFVTSAGRVNSSTLFYLSRQDGKQVDATDVHRLTDLNLYKRRYEQADLVVAAEPGVDEFENWLPSYNILGQTLRLLRESPDFHEVGSVASQSGKHFYVFARRPAFGGWNSTAGLSSAEGPFPQTGLPIIRWGLHPAVTLELSTASAGAYRLIADGSPPIANQRMTVTVDGREAGRHTFTATGVFDRVEVPLDLSAGDHEIVLTFTGYKPPDASDNRKLALLFRRLQIIPAPPAPTTRP
ncbi:MAG TPA: methyltransferase domain-containing protein [Tepidisphaeraceae bacterium]|jgi:SAM-dependent methyltransferase|nr:methyltransferase domain-containing protein [Tepidisphaeraceae bacterium]